MTSFEPVQAGPYLTPSDPPDLANITKLVVDWAALRSNMRFASTAARDAAIPAPAEGMECVTGTGAAMTKWRYFAAAWVDITVVPWTAYTPVWTASGTAPALGNGQLTGTYSRVGKNWSFRIFFQPGSTSTFGTGTYSITLPVATSVVVGSPIGVARAQNAGNYFLAGITVIAASTTTAIELPTSTTNVSMVKVGQLVPWTIKATDIFYVSGTYQAT